MDGLGEVGLARRMGAISHGRTMLSARASSFLLRSTPKGTISLSAIGTWEEESFVAAGDERLVGMALEASRSSLYSGEK